MPRPTKYSKCAGLAFNIGKQNASVIDDGIFNLARIPTMDMAHLPLPATIAAVLSDHDLTRHPLTIIPTMDDAHIPNVETLSYGAAFVEAQIPHTWVNAFHCQADYIGVGDLANLLYKKSGWYAFINEPLALQSGLLIGGSPAGGSPTWGATEVITVARVLQNVTANASIITAGVFDEARLDHSWSSAFDLSNYLDIARTLATDIAIQIWHAVDEFASFIQYADGSMKWGSGADLLDTNLYRSVPNYLKTDDNFASLSLTINGTSVISSARALQNVTANASIINAGIFDLARIPTMDDAHIPNLETLSYGAAFVEAQIPHTFANVVELTSGITIGTDTNLYRSATNVLKTDDTFNALALQIGGISVIDSARNIANVASLSLTGDVEMNSHLFNLTTKTNPTHMFWNGTVGTDTREWLNTNIGFAIQAYLGNKVHDFLPSGNAWHAGSLVVGGASLTHRARILTHQDVAITTGAITVTDEYVTINAAGTLLTINGGVDGMIVTIMVNGTYTVNVVQDSGNINLCLSSGTGIQLINTKSFLRLVYRSAYSKWQSLGYFAIPY